MIATVEKTTFSIDASHTTVEFVVRHMMIGRTKGVFEGVSGTVVIDPNNHAASSVDVAIDINSINSKDEKRDAHLRSADFFDAENNPSMTFRSTRIESTGGDRLKVHGDLTIRDVTKPVVLDATFLGEAVSPWGASVAAFDATTKINRKDFGLVWNVAMETGGVLVGEEVTIHIEVEAVKQA